MSKIQYDPPSYGWAKWSLGVICALVLGLIFFLSSAYSGSGIGEVIAQDSAAKGANGNKQSGSSLHSSLSSPFGRGNALPSDEVIEKADASVVDEQPDVVNADVRPVDAFIRSNYEKVNGLGVQISKYRDGNTCPHFIAQFDNAFYATAMMSEDVDILRYLYKNSPPASQPHIIAGEKLRAIATAKIASVTDISLLRTLASESYDSSEEEKVINEKRDALILSQLGAVKTDDELYKLFNSSRPDSDVEKEVMTTYFVSQMRSTETGDIEVFLKMSEFSLNALWAQLAEVSELEPLRHRINEYYMQQIRSASDREALIDVYYQVPNGAPASKQAADMLTGYSERDVQNAHTLDELTKIILTGYVDSSAAQLAQERVEAMIREQILNIKTSDELYRLYSAGNSLSNIRYDRLRSLIKQKEESFKPECPS